jgi:altronate hydrolase
MMPVQADHASNTASVPAMGGALEAFRNSPVIRLHAADNVWVAKAAIGLGQTLPSAGVKARAQVPAGHKLAAQAIAAGAPIRKYNAVIGVATRDIAAGDYVHTHNMGLGEFHRDPAFCADLRPVGPLPLAQRASFMGYRRADGRVGTRNYVGLVASVNCSATAIHRIAAHFTPEVLRAYPNVDGVVAFAQTSGCGMSSPSPHFDLLRRTLAGYASHPNMGGAIIVGLGCERNQVADMVASQGLAEGPLLRTMVMQDTGGTRAAVEAGIAAVVAMLPQANACVRERVDASHLRVGLQCGGSDGFSAITANPALGAAMDLLVRHGGTAILSETPEIHGVEHLLTRRAITPDVGQKLIDLMAWWADYTRGHNGQFNGVVGPGNQAGGLANIIEKSLGSAMKGGTTPLVDVIGYAQPVTKPGLVFMDTPGYDPVSATGQIAGGANMICFTTGRGSMFGSKPAPTLKLASNSAMYARLQEDMDINCGTILDGLADVDGVGQEIFEAILRHASGERTKSELLGLGDHEFVPWHLGIVS